MDSGIDFPSQARKLTSSWFDRRETTPLREAEAESGELESTERPHTAEKMPSEAELEEFFSVAERNLQKQFIDK